MAEHGTGEGERNGGHDQERLPVGAESDRQQNVHQRDHDELQGHYLLQEFLLALGIADGPDRHPWVALAPLGEEVLVQILANVARGIGIGQLCANRYRPLTVAATNPADAGSELGFGDRHEWHFAPVGGAYPQVVDRIQAVTQLARIADHDPNIFTFARETLSFLTVEGLADLACHVGEGQAQGLRVRLQ